MNENDSWLPLMTSAQVIAAVNYWQTEVPFHPLTCGNDSNHRVLYAEEREGKVVMYCMDCDYVQDWIPEVVLATYMSHKPHGCPGCGGTVHGKRMWWGDDGKAWHVECYFGVEVPEKR